MAWNLSSDRPIYIQLVEHIETDIISGIYKPGDKLPSVRDLAAEAAVNPNTMQKALAELESGGLLYAQRTSGRYITDDAALVNERKNTLAKEQIRSFLSKMQQLGLTAKEAADLILETIKEREVS
ncbi:GntR family transcriptional regulator [Anaerolentibacter hominis]|uniref:GntR family transcriptional regulator n=1 Tax=Anaerolentibacter hominis TaxID=3079009 RepID=UPI0031B80314